LLFPAEYGIMVSARGSSPLRRNRKGEQAMNEIERLRNDARAVIADCHAGDDIEAAVSRLAAIGYALEDALARA